MIGAFSSAWTMLKRPTIVWPLLAAIVVFSAMSIVFTFSTAAAPGGSRFTDPPTLLADLADPDALVQFVGRPVMVTGLVVLAASILHVTGQYSSGLVRMQFVVQPRRSTWFLGNWAALATAAIACALIGALTAVASGYVCAAIWGVDTGEWLSGLGGAASATANLALGMVAFALAGATLALWLRSSIAALTVALVYALFENMINAAAPFGQGLMPASAFSTVATSGLNGNLYLPSLIATIVLTVAFTAGAFGLVMNRNVTD